jgi:hypothetical protein|tara:strand:+ start:736 stop:1047 length:312 start_codon:yes stop_codon:yes gene_type:complete
MSRNLIKPFFPRPPDEYDQQYMATLVQSFALYLEQIQNPGEGRHTQLTLTNLQDSDQGLEVGALFQYRDAAGLSGVVRIVSVNQVNLPGISGTGAVGSVTVST